MRIVVVGAGAMGSLFAEHLAQTHNRMLYHLVRTLEAGYGPGPGR